MTTKITSKKFSVLVLTLGIYPDYIGGAEIQLFNLLNKLAERGHNIRVITSANNELNEPSTHNQTFTKFYLNLWPTPFNILSYTLKSLILSLKFRKQIDIVHVQTAGYHGIIAGFLFSLFNRKPYLIACRGSDIRLSSRSKLMRFFQLPFLRNAKILTAVSGEIADLLTRKYGISKHKVLVIANGYDNGVIRKTANIKVHDDNPMSKRVVCVANMRPEKDHMTLLKGFAILRKRVNDVELLLIGDGPLRRKLEEYCAKQSLSGIRFLGRLPHSDVLGNVAKSDIFILTSIEEAMPNVVIEALALGKPVIATRVGGIPELVHDEYNGLLIPPNSPEHVAKSLLMLLTDESLYSKLSENTIKSVRNRSWNEIVLQYEQIYTYLL